MSAGLVPSGSSGGRSGFPSFWRHPVSWTHGPSSVFRAAAQGLQLSHPSCDRPTSLLGGPCDDTGTPGESRVTSHLRVLNPIC